MCCPLARSRRSRSCRRRPATRPTPGMAPCGASRRAARPAATPLGRRRPPFWRRGGSAYTPRRSGGWQRCRAAARGARFSEARHRTRLALTALRIEFPFASHACHTCPPRRPSASVCDQAVRGCGPPDPVLAEHASKEPTASQPRVRRVHASHFHSTAITLVEAPCPTAVASDALSSASSPAPPGVPDFDDAFFRSIASRADAHGMALVARPRRRRTGPPLLPARLPVPERQAGRAVPRCPDRSPLDSHGTCCRRGARRPRSTHSAASIVSGPGQAAA